MLLESALMLTVKLTVTALIRMSIPVFVLLVSSVIAVPVSVLASMNMLRFHQNNFGKIITETAAGKESKSGALRPPILVLIEFPF
ncbi:MAG TPA: hypothetical protein V6C72_03255 [Chroococcales cyanobacterium]